MSLSENSLIFESRDAFLQQILDSVQAGICMLNRDMHIVFANAWMQKTYSSHVPLEGKPCYRVFQERPAACPFCPVLKTLVNGQVHFSDVPYTVHSHAKGILRATAYPILDASGRVQGVIKYCIDITEEVNSKKALRTEKEKFRLFADFTANWEYWVSTREEMIYTSPACEDITGYGPQEFIRDPHLLSRIVHPQDQHVFREHKNRFLPESNEYCEIQFRIITRNGETRWLHHQCRPVFDSRGNHLGRRVSHSDITRRIEAETREKERQEQLRQASKMASLGTLVAGVGHEINSPNNFIMLNTPLLQEVWNDVLPVLENHAREQGEFNLAGMPFSSMRRHVPELFNGIMEGSRRIKSIVSDLKDFARQTPLHTDQPVNINQVVEKSLSLMSQMIAKHTKNFQVVYGDDLPAVQGDFQKLEQVIVNLIINACQALDSRDQKISVRTGFDAEKNAAVIQVRDEGRGIDDSDRDRLLDPFFTTRLRDGGTGLGLSIASSIIQDHGGRLVFDSQPGQGTVFRVYLYPKK